MNRARIKLIGFLIITVVTFFSFSQPLFAYSYNEVFGKYPPYTINWGCPLPSWAQINSKWNQPRNVGTNPHQGVDVQASSGTRVNAVWNGWVEKIDSDTMRLLIDVNNDQIKNETVHYCYYDHLSYIKPNAYYVKGAQVGNSGGNPAHLHFGVRNSSLKWCRNEANYRYTTYWYNGRDVDVFSREQWSGSSCQITIYIRDEGVNKIAGEVRIYHRKNGTSTWTNGGSMTRSGYVYSYSFSGKYPSGTSINWLVRIKRTDIVITYPYCFAPAKYDQPNENPNATSYAYAFFTNTLN